MSPELVLSPADFVAITNQTFEFALPFVCIEGELAEFKVRKNQWLYFKVKDDFASVDCFGTIYMLPGPIEDGMKVRITGRPKLHEKFGFSFQVQSIQPAGEGSIKKAFELLKIKLEAEGLFETSRKRQLPYPPEKIAVITSKEGAAIGDFKKILAERWPYAQLDVHDAFVQGEKAPDSVAKALSKINESAEKPDVIVIIRGGGSAEDLSAFNDERLVRAISASRTPTLVAIGHEQDESLAELVADKRASTPSNAAELLVPDKLVEQKEVKKLSANVNKLINVFITRLQDDLEAKKNKLTLGFNSAIGLELKLTETYRHLLNLVDPKQVLKRGYVLVKNNNELIRSVKLAKSGANVELVFYDGSKHATIGIDE